MPTYEYQCTSCGREFEVRQRISEPALTRCEQCGGVVKRLLSSAPFILKGEGWYVTDYPSESRKKALESEKSSGSVASKDSTSAGTPSPEKIEKAPAPAGGSAPTSAPPPAKSPTD